MKEINYLEIIKKAWNITWHNKFLWWFGLFLALGGGFNFNVTGQNNWAKNLENKGDWLGNFLAEHWIAVAIAATILAVLAIIFLILKTIAFAGLLKSLIKIERDEKTSFRKEFKKGKKYFWRIIGAEIIISLVAFGIATILVVPALFLFVYFESFAFGLILSFLAMIIFIPLIVLAVYLSRYARFYIVLSDLNIKDSLENSYKVFRKNIFPSILMSLLFIPINMLMVLVFVGLLFVLVLVFLIPGITAYFIFSTVGVVAVCLFACFILAAAFIFASSIYLTFLQTAWFLFFKEIATVKEDPIKETETEIIENIPHPEEA